MTTTTRTHSDLVTLAERFCRSQGFAPVLTEPRKMFGGNSTQEWPDAIGWGQWGATIVMEAKASVSDFSADHKKPSRINPHTGMGVLRYYIADEYVLDCDTVARLRWGLIEVLPDGTFQESVTSPKHVRRDVIAETDMLRTYCVHLEKVSGRKASDARPSKRKSIPGDLIPDIQTAIRSMPYCFYNDVLDSVPGLIRAFGNSKLKARNALMNEIGSIDGVRVDTSDSRHRLYMEA